MEGEEQGEKQENGVSGYGFLFPSGHWPGVAQEKEGRVSCVGSSDLV